MGALQKSSRKLHVDGLNDRIILFRRRDPTLSTKPLEAAGGVIVGRSSGRVFKLGILKVQYVP